MARNISSEPMSEKISAGGGDTNNNKDILDDMKDRFQISMDAEQEQREQMLDDLKFARLADQWPAEIANQRKLEGRPMLTINRLPSFIRQVVNDARQNRPQIKVKPVDGSGDRATANVFAGLIRQIENYSQADIAYDTAMDFAVSCGIGYYRVDIEYGKGYTFDKKLCIKRVQNVFSVYGDPASKEATSSDWNVGFIVDTMSKQEFEREFKDAEPVDWSNSDYTALQSPWLEDDQVLLCEAWTREKEPTEIVLLSDGSIQRYEEYLNIKDYLDVIGITVQASRTVDDYKITQRLMTGAEILSETSWAGKYIPIIPVYGEEINVEGKRQFNSLIHQAKDAQRMFNYWRSTATELVALAPRVPWIGEEGSFDVEGEETKWQNSNTKSYAFLQYKKGRQPPVRQMLDSGPAAGALSEAMQANDDIKSIIGMFDASLGSRSNEVSGKAIMARQREGDVSTFAYIDNLARSLQHCGNILVDLIPNVYTGDKIIRIIDEEGKNKTVQLGKVASPMPQPSMMPSPMTSGMSGIGMGLSPPPAPPSSMPPMPGAPPGVAGGSQGAMLSAPPGADLHLEGVFDLSAGEYDVVVDTGPSITTRREEIAMQMTEFTKVMPQMLPLIGDLMVKALDWPQADMIAERMEQARNRDAQREELEKKIQMLEVENKMLKMQASAEMEDVKVNQFEAETGRIKVLGDIRKDGTDASLKKTDQYINVFKASKEREAPVNGRT